MRHRPLPVLRPHRPATIRRAAILSLALLAGTGPLHAADRTWDGNGSSDDWSFAAASGGNTNWTHVASPGQPVLSNGDRLVFAGNARLTNHNDYTGLSLSGMVFKGGAGGFTLGGNALTSTGDIVNSSGSMQRLSFASLAVGANQVWDGGSGGLTVDAFNLDRHRLELRGTVALRSGLASTVIGRNLDATLVAGAGSTITTGLTFLADQAGSSASVRLDQGAAWAADGLFYVGTRGHGELTLDRGATLDSTGGHVGRFAGSSGTVRIGSDSRWTSADQVLHVGYAGTGLLQVQDGGRLNAYALNVGQAGGAGTVTLEGSGQLKPASTLAALGSLVTLGGAGWGRLVQAGTSYADVSDVRIQAPDAGIDGLGSSWTLRDRASATAYDVVVGASGAIEARDNSQLRFLTLSLGSSGADNAQAPAAQLLLRGQAQARIDSLSLGAMHASRVEIRDGATLRAMDIDVHGLGQVLLNGGSLVTDRLSLADPSQLDWRAGTLSLAALTLGADASLGPVLVVPGGGSLIGRQGTTLGSGSLLVLSRPGVSFTTTSLSMAGGTIVGPLGLASTGNVSGHGTVLGRVSGGSSNRDVAASGGALTLGNLALDDAVLLNHRLVVRTAATAVLLSANEAVLGGGANLTDGGLLASINGIVLPTGRRLDLLLGASAHVQGRFVNHGQVAAAVGATLTFDDDVSGDGSFSGRIVFSDGYTPGTAAVSFGGGDIVFDATSELALTIGADAVAGLHGRLVDIGQLTLDGGLRLDFTPDFAARAASGLVLDLADFGQFAGRFDLARVQVNGFDASRLDFANFSADGTVTVTAVPEPTSALLMALGVAALVARRRRNSSR